MPGVALAVALAIIVVLGELVAEELAVALVVPAVLGSLFGVPVILSEVFRHAGVHMGFPLVSSVILALFSNTVAAIAGFWIIGEVGERITSTFKKGDKPVEAIEPEWDYSNPQYIKQ